VKYTQHSTNKLNVTKLKLADVEVPRFTYDPEVPGRASAVLLVGAVFVIIVEFPKNSSGLRLYILI
jgi:hypothetical protein